MAITRRQALDFFRSDDLIGLGIEADAVRRTLHPEGVVTYLIDRSIPCANPGTGISDLEAICGQIAETVEMGGTGVLLEGCFPAGANPGPNPRTDLAPLVNLLRGIKQRFPQVSVQCFPAPEILAIAHANSLSVGDTLARLRDAGLDSIPGDGVAFLDPGTPAPASKCGMEDWIAVHRAAHQLGMSTAAAMLFGTGETLEQRFDHLEQVRRLQEETGGFTAFLPRNLPGPSGISGRDEATAVEYLKVLAVARLYLDNIENLQSSWDTQGLKVLQMGLRFGGNDAGSVTPAGASKSTTEEELRRIIRGAGFKPVQRDTLYRTMFLN